MLHKGDLGRFSKMVPSFTSSAAGSHCFLSQTSQSRTPLARTSRTLPGRAKSLEAGAQNSTTELQRKMSSGLLLRNLNSNLPQSTNHTIYNISITWELSISTSISPLKEPVKGNLGFLSILISFTATQSFVGSRLWPPPWQGLSPGPQTYAPRSPVSELAAGVPLCSFWAAVKELNLSYHNVEIQ